MSRRNQLRRRLETLEEIGAIMDAIRNIALMETHKLSRFRAHQHRVVAGIEAAAADFLAHYPEFLTPAVESNVIVAVGSQRGFCGDFNESVAQAVRSHCARAGVAARILVVGHRLRARFGADANVIGVVDGPGAVEEVQPVLHHVMEALGALHSDASDAQPIDVALVAHEEGSAEIRIRGVLPEIPRMSRPQFAFPPRLNLSPAEFFRGLLEHYLWARMHDAFFGSLMAENRRRLQHLEGAMQRMEQKSAALRRKYNALRQEEITEEIEVILLSGDALRRARDPRLEIRT